MYPRTKEQLIALKAIAKALKIKAKLQSSPYDPEFVLMIKDAERRGNFREIDPNDVLGDLK